jgi:hypothetical protein
MLLQYGIDVAVRYIEHVGHQSLGILQCQHFLARLRPLDGSVEDHLQRTPIDLESDERNEQLCYTEGNLLHTQYSVQNGFRWYYSQETDASLCSSVNTVYPSENGDTRRTARHVSQWTAVKIMYQWFCTPTNDVIRIKQETGEKNCRWKATSKY